MSVDFEDALYVSLKGACKFLSVPSFIIFRLIEQGKLKPLYFGPKQYDSKKGKMKFDMEALRKLKLEQK